MAIDLVLLVLLILFVLHGYSQGFVKGLNSCISPVLGMWLALRNCDGPASLLHHVVANYTVCRLAGFFLILICIWIGLKLAHRLLLRLVDWPRYAELDCFLGGCLGLAKAAVMAWVVLAATLSAFPPAVRVIERSNASVRLLALGERASGPIPNRGEGLAGPGNPFPGVTDTLALLQQPERNYETRIPQP